MLAYRYPIIAREGWAWIAMAIIAAGLVQMLFTWIALPLWMLVLVLCFLFRDPARKVPASPLGIVSPVDGSVVSVETVEDGYLDRKAMCISIQMSITSVYSIHSPMEGKIIEQWLKVPRKIIARNQNSSTESDTYAQWIQSDEEDNVVLVVEGKSHSSGPQCYARSGERVGQGQRCGYIRFGSRVDILVPEGSRIDVAVGAKVKAGSDIIASLIHAEVSPPQIEAANIEGASD